MTLSRPSEYAEVNRSKDVPWYLPSINPRLRSEALTKLLKEYSGIEEDEQEAHLLAIRERAFAIYPMPCIGLFWWLVLGLSTHPFYPSLLKFMRTSPQKKVLDLGTCLGQDLRKLAFDGVPVSSLYGCDIMPAYEEVGYELFRDKQKLGGRFIKGDIFAAPGAGDALMETKASWDVIIVNMFLHAFSLPQQTRAASRILSLLSSNPQSKIIGIQAASTVAGVHILRYPFLKEGVQKEIWRHSRESFVKMWEEVARKEGLKIKVWADYRERVELGNKEDASGHTRAAGFFRGEGEVQKRLFFQVERL